MARVSGNLVLSAPPTPAIAEKINKMVRDEQLSSKVTEMLEGGKRGENTLGKEVAYYQPELGSLRREKCASGIYEETSDQFVGVERSSTEGFDLNVTPKNRSRRNKHRPKVFKEGKPSRKPRAVTYPSAKDDKSRCNDTLCKNKYVRRNKDLTSSSDIENVSCKSKYVQRVKNVTHSLEIDTNASGEIVDEGIMLKAKSLRRCLNFDLEESQALDEFSAAMPMFKIVFGAHGMRVYDEGALTSSNIKEAADLARVQEQVDVKTSAESTFDPNYSTYQSKNEYLQEILMPFTCAEKISSLKLSVKHFKALARKTACFDSTTIKQQSMQKNVGIIQPSTPEKQSNFSRAFESKIWENQAHQETYEDINISSKKARGQLRYPGPSSAKHAYVEEWEVAHWNDKYPTQKKAEIGFLATKSSNSKDLNPKAMSVVCQSTSYLNVSAHSFVSSATLAPFTDQVDYIAQRLRHLSISRYHEVDRFHPQNAVVPYGQHEFLMVPFDRNIERIKRQRPRAKVDLDPESNRIWNLLMGKDCSEGDKPSDVDQKKWWDKERRVFQGRVDSFIARMHLVQGDRRFSQWKGSVVDSVVGVFLTQNVSDHLSSSAFMALAANFPIRSRDKCSSPKGENINIFSTTQNKCIIPFNESSELSASVFNNWPFFQHSLGVNVSQIWFRQETSNCSKTLGSITSSNITYYSRKKARVKCSDLCKREVIFCQESIDGESCINLTEMRDVGLSEDCATSRNSIVSTQKKVGSSFKSETYTFSQTFSETPTSATKKRKSRPNIEKATYDWEMLRKKICCNKPVQERCSTTMDSVDWDAVRTSDVSKIAQAIRGRGMNNKLAERIKEFLNRVIKEHKSIDLEWLRDAPPNKVKDYLLSIRGLGLKSAECVRLLTLRQLAFPVDTNVGRICVRLGWVPLQPLPESLQLHLLELYPVLATIQKYLWPRLCKLDQRTLYELHYQMITFGKVFCTKRMPNCNSCPMRGECRHFASAFASARLALPAPEKKSVVSPTTQLGSEKSLGFLINPRLFSQSDGSSNSLESTFQNNCEPIIEEPASPEQPESQQTLESAIEDTFYEDIEEIPTMKLNFKVFKKNLQNYVEENIELQDGSLSKSLVALNPEAASIPMPKLKNVCRLRTEHQVFQWGTDLHLW